MSDTQTQITIALDYIGENQRGKLRSIKCPVIRNWIIGITIVLIALVTLFIIGQETSVAGKLGQTLVAIIAIPLLVWSLWSYRYMASLGSVTDLNHLVSGEQKIFHYAIGPDGITEQAEIAETLYPYYQYVSHGSRDSVDWIAFKHGLVYLPRYAVKSGSVEEFTRTFHEACDQKQGIA